MGWRYGLAQAASMIGIEAPAMDAGITGVSKDTRTLKPGDLYIALRGESFDGEAFVGDAFAAGAAAALCRTAHEAGPCLVVSNPLKALQRFAGVHRNRFDIPVLAITGSAGKTTSKDFVSAVLGTKYRITKTKGNLNNDIGCPLSLLEIDDETEFAVIEMGANHAGEIAELCTWARPTESVITMVAPAHLEGFGSIENVAAAKAEIMEALPPEGTFYINTDDARCVAIGERFAGNTVRYGSGGDVSLRDWSFDAEGRLKLDIDPIGPLRLPLRSRALVSNVLLAVAVGLRHGVSEFQNALEQACRDSVRFRVIEIAGLTVIDDTYNANPASVAAALRALAEWPGARERWAVLGDMLELGVDAKRLHGEVGTLAGSLGIQHLIARGEFAGEIIEAAQAAGVSHAEAIQEHEVIAKIVAENAVPGDVALVKGSRGMKMEKIVDNLRGMLQNPRGGNE